MYDFIEGRLVSRETDRVVIQAGGIGYLLHVSLATYERLAEGQTVRLYTHLYVREDCLRLYGFLNPDERTIYRKLVSVSSVGPEKALSFLSTLPLAQIQKAVTEADVAALTRVKGIGRKIAERIVVELRDALAVPLPGTESARPENVAQATSGMLSLGYRPHEAARAVDKAVKTLGKDAAVEDLIREALRHAT